MKPIENQINESENDSSPFILTSNNVLGTINTLDDLGYLKTLLKNVKENPDVFSIEYFNKYPDAKIMSELSILDAMEHLIENKLEGNEKRMLIIEYNRIVPSKRTVDVSDIFDVVSFFVNPLDFLMSE